MVDRRVDEAEMVLGRPPAGDRQGCLSDFLVGMVLAHFFAFRVTDGCGETVWGGDGAVTDFLIPMKFITGTNKQYSLLWILPAQLAIRGAVAPWW